MSNDGIGKIRRKRKNDICKPYARNQSFLGKVKDTVTDKVKEIFYPSWISGIVSSFSSKPKSNSAPSTPLMTELKPDTNLSSSTPRRTTYPSVPFNAFQRSNRLQPPLKPYSTVDGNVPFSNYAPTVQVATSSSVGAYEEQSNLSDYSLSTGLTSSVAPQVDRQDYQKEILSLDDEKLQQLHDELEKKDNAPVSSRKKPEADPQPPDLDVSAISDKAENTSFFSQPSKRARTKGPQFNASLFTTPKPSSEGSMMLGTSAQQSPYYPGKTVYGGAASHRKSRLKATAPYQSNVSVKKVASRPQKRSSVGPVTSSTARRILDALESMPSVLHDAKRIPVNNSSLYESPLSFTPSSYERRRSLQPMSSRHGTPAGGPPTSRVSALGIASIAKNRQYLLQGRERPVVQEEEASHQDQKRDAAASKPPSVSVQEPSAQSSGKMRREKSHHYTARHEDDEDQEVPDLPTKFTLPAAGIQLNFDIKTPTVKAKAPATSFAASTAATSVEGPKFTFSSPIAKVNSPVTASATTLSGFQFSAPLKIDKENKAEKENPLLSGVTFGTPSTLKLKTKQPSTPKESSFGSGFAPASELKQGSVLDILSKASAFKASTSEKLSTPVAKKPETKSSPITTAAFLDKFKPAPGSWSCPVCMVSNKPDAMTCAACMAAKPSDVKKDSLQTSAFKLSESRSKDSWDCKVCKKVNTGDKCANCGSKKSQASAASSELWDCSTCLLQNKPDRNTCIACEAQRPRPKDSTPVSSRNVKTDPDLLAKFKEPEGTWSCPVCMISNKPDASKCAACETANPKAIKTDNALFQKFKVPAGEWECGVCMVSNKADAGTCIACTSPKPASKPAVSAAPKVAADPTLLAKFSVPKDNWECSVCMVSNEADVNSCIACATPKPASKPSTSSAPNMKTDSSLLAKFKTPEDSWTCDTCLISNNGTALKCIACETPKPGAVKASGFAKPGFQFGASSGSGFVIGGDSKSSGGAFTFGASKSESSTGSSSKPSSIDVGFKFGQSSDSTGSSGSKLTNATSIPSSAGAFAFGAAASSAKETAPASVGFAFGAKPEEKKDAPSISFGAKAGPAEKPAPVIGGFKFDAGKGASTGKSALAGEIQFGQSSINSESKSIGGFNFGAVKTETKETSKPPVLTDVLSATKTNSASLPSYSQATNTSNAPGVFAFGASTKRKAGSDKGPEAKSTPRLAPAKSASGAPNPTTTGGFSFDPKPSSIPAFGQSSIGTPSNNGPTTTTPAFSFGSSAPASTNSGTFVFGQSANSQAQPTSSSSTFVFGQTANSAATTSTSAAPSFGAPATTKGQTFGGFGAPTSQPQVPAFGAATAPSFGQPQTNTANLFGSQTNPAPGSQQTTSTPFSQATPTLGATAPGLAIPAFGSAATTTPAVPAFGAPTTATSAAPVFGAGASNFGALSSAPTGFGASSSTTTGFGAPISTGEQKAAFNFTQSTTPGTFNFGSQQQAPSAPFQFGAKQEAQPTPAPSQPPQSSGFNFSTSAAPNFNFAAAAPAPANPAAPAQPFQFGASSSGQPSTDGNPFSVTPTPNITGRKIKRATRKLKGR